MKTTTTKAPKVALCRMCHGTGRKGEDICPQCEGSGRVTVSCEMTLDIRPYHPKVKRTTNNLPHGKATRTKLSETCC